VDWRAVYAVLAIRTIALVWAIGRAGLKSERRADAVASPFAALRVTGLAPTLASEMRYMAAFYGLYA
jgi:hypothetical protein